MQQKKTIRNVKSATAPCQTASSRGQRILINPAGTSRETYTRGKLIMDLKAKCGYKQEAAIRRIALLLQGIIFVLGTVAVGSDQNGLSMYFFVFYYDVQFSRKIKFSELRRNLLVDHFVQQYNTETFRRSGGICQVQRYPLLFQRTGKPPKPVLSLHAE